MARIVAAESDEDYRVARTLIDEYVESLDFVLDFQDYESERLHLPEHYGSPGGRLLLAFEGTHAVGCVALFGQSESACSPLITAAAKARQVGSPQALQFDLSVSFNTSMADFSSAMAESVLFGCFFR